MCHIHGCRDTCIDQWHKRSVNISKIHIFIQMAANRFTVNIITHMQMAVYGLLLNYS